MIKRRCKSFVDGAENCLNCGHDNDYDDDDDDDDGGIHKLAKI